MRNQARVHLWFPGKFGEPYEPLTSSSEALERFVSPVFAVTVRLEADDRLMICAPFGLQDLFALINNIIFFWNFRVPDHRDGGDGVSTVPESKGVAGAFGLNAFL